MDVRLNTGQLHQQPLETVYSIFRRLKSSNRLLTTDDFNRYFIWRNARNYKDRVKILLRLNYGAEHYLPEYYDAINGHQINEQANFKHCRSCSRLHYHSVLFNLPWFKRCPIHDELLVEKCTVCNQIPRVTNQVFNLNCPVCGLYFSKLDVGRLLPLRKEIQNVLVPIYNEHVASNHDNVNVIYFNGTFAKNGTRAKNANFFLESYLPTITISSERKQKTLLAAYSGSI